MTFLLSQGHRHDSAFFHDLFERGFESTQRTGRAKPDKLAADKAYRAKHILKRLRREGIDAVIPKKSNELPTANEPAFDKATYKRRNIVERLIGWLKQWRAIATRYEKLARNYRAMLTLALIERSLRRNA